MQVVSATPGTASRRRRNATTRNAIQQTALDFVESCGRVACKTHLPTRKDILEFLGSQVVLVNAVAWTAGVMATFLVEKFFETKSFRNLWGLTASSSRTLVSPDDYQVIMTLASYSAGLMMLILMRHLILRLITEFRSVRLDRVRDNRASPPEIRGLEVRASPEPRGRVRDATRRA